MKKILPIIFILLLSSCSQEPLSLNDGTDYRITCTNSDPNSKEKYITRMQKGAAEYRSGRSEYCRGSACEEFARDRDVIVEACKIVPYASIKTFSFKIDVLEDSKELGASLWYFESCGTTIEDLEGTMTFTPSVITFNIPDWNISNYDVDRKTLQGGPRGSDYAYIDNDTCTVLETPIRH
jgi:hypothetical protein